MEGLIKIKQSDLVLRVKENYDPATLNLASWNHYLDCLCGARNYQKEAIRTAILYLATGNYADINQLAKENYTLNSALREKYKSCDDFIAHLPLPGKLSAVIDLATATGKSYVMYGIAQIMLSIGLVKRVLLLCPSVTIERELTNKFKELAVRKDLIDSLPTNTCAVRPSITDASSTICEGDICIENIHAVYDKAATSIKDSFLSGGGDTLVLSDEVHHAYNSSGEKDIRKWKEFLQGEYGFRFLMGFTGTAYIGNDYFPDVIYRYSLKQAIGDKVTKSIEYVSKDDRSNIFEKFQLIYDNHIEICRKNSALKPLSIFVSKDIKSAENLSLEFTDFLVDTKKIDRDIAQTLVSVVTSAPRHRQNVTALQNVDKKENPVEWIFSVSMLTEGWDVKNVFQIVPWEDRAFNSKLLIAQVLGRGLRIPKDYTIQPYVRVFNHASWSKSIQALVDEVLELELELKSSAIIEGLRAKFNFELHTFNYNQEERTAEKKLNKHQETFDLTKKIALISQTPTDKKVTEYEDIGRYIGGEMEVPIKKTTVVEREMMSVDAVVNRIVESFKGRALEAKLVFPEGEYEKENLPPVNVIRKYIQDSMWACGIEGDLLTAENANKIYGRFTGLLRRKPATPIFVRKGGPVKTISTRDMRVSARSFSMLTKDITIFTSNDICNELSKEEVEIYQAIRGEMKTKQVCEVNTGCFKTPIDIVFTQLEPERRFTELLVSSDVSTHIDAWIKSRDVGFYKIDYQLNKGSAFQEFNPDYFILCGENVAVVETKSDGDDSEINCAKYRAGKRHFELLNKALEKESSQRRYFFYFLSPTDYSTFFDYLSDGRLFKSTFRGKMIDLLEKKIEAMNGREE